MLKKLLTEWRGTILLLFLILVASFALRVYNLTTLPVFADEAIYIRWSQVMGNEPTLRFLPLSDGKQPLYMWGLMFLVSKFSDPLFIARFISVLASLGTVVGVFVLTFYLLKNKTASLVAALMWTLSPYTFFFDRMALVDATLACFAVWTATLGIWFAKSRRLDAALLTGITLGLAMLTKSPALFFGILLLPTVIIFNYKNLKKNYYVFGLLLVVYGIAFAMYNILRLGPNFHLLTSRNFDYVYPYSHILTEPLNPLRGHLGGIQNYFVVLAPLGLTLLAIFGFFKNIKNYGKETIMLFLWVGVPIFLIAEYSKVVTARYLLFIMPFFIVLAASSFNNISLKYKNVVLLFMAIFMAHSLYVITLLHTDVYKAPLPQGERSGYLEEWTAGQGIKEISEFVKSEHAKDPTHKIVVGTEGYFGTLPNGLEMYMEGTPNVIVVGIGLGINKVPESLVESYESGNKTYLVINKSRIIESPDKLGLKLIAEYKKGLRTEGSIEYDRHGPQESLYFFEVTK